MIPISTIRQRACSVPISIGNTSLLKTDQKLQTVAKTCFSMPAHSFFEDDFSWDEKENVRKNLKRNNPSPVTSESAEGSEKKMTLSSEEETSLSTGEEITLSSEEDTPLFIKGENCDWSLQFVMDLDSSEESLNFT